MMMDWHTALPGDSRISDNSVGVVQNIRAIVTYGSWILEGTEPSALYQGVLRTQLDMYYM